MSGTERRELPSDVRLYQDVQAISNYVRTSARWDSIQDHLRDQMVWRLSLEIAAKKIDEQVHEIHEVPVWHDARSQYAASMPPNSFRRRFLMHFWNLSEVDLKPTCIKHTVTVKRWTEHPEVGIPKQNIEDMMGFWA